MSISFFSNSGHTRTRKIWLVIGAVLLLQTDSASIINETITNL